MTLDQTALIAVDWGTTSARAYRLDPEGTVREERAAPIGIQQVRGGFPDALSTLLGDWFDDPAPRLACGMIGSRQGWVEAPYVECPTSLDALARGVVRTDDGALAIVPGVACRDAEGVPDVMRGEETQIAGAVAEGTAPTLVVLPGTHSKWALVRDGAIVSFATYMTGEVYAVLRDHSILGRMLAPQGDRFAATAFARGVRRGLTQGADLLHTLFGARTLPLTGALAPEDVGDYLSGMLIGSEIAAGQAFARAQGVPPDSVLLIGSRTLCDRYALAVREAVIAPRIAPEYAAARGLWRIARAGAVVAAR